MFYSHTEWDYLRTITEEVALLKMAISGSCGIHIVKAIGRNHVTGILSLLSLEKGGLVPDPHQFIRMLSVE